MAVITTAISIICPTCGKKGFIDVNEESIRNSPKGLSAISLTTGLVCQHSFFAYIDRNFSIRDYFTVDFEIGLPELQLSPEEKESETPSTLGFDGDLIRFNATTSFLISVLKVIFSKQKFVIVLKEEVLFPHFKACLDYITQNSFITDFVLVTPEDYEKKKKDYKDAIVFKNNEILRDAKRIINLKKLVIEKNIVGRFVLEKEITNGFIILKNEVKKAYNFAKTIVDLINDAKIKGEYVNLLKIQTELDNVYKTKFNTLYLNFLVDIVKYYFNISVPSISESFLGI